MAYGWHECWSIPERADSSGCYPADQSTTKQHSSAANENFKSEPIHVYKGIPDGRKSYTPLNMRKRPTVDQGTRSDQQKPALFAMEINVQKDLRTGESCVLSTCTVPAHEIQQRGIKVYDDGLKSVYAVHTALDQPEASGVDELSPKEVEELLKQATEKRKKPKEQNKPQCLKNYQNSHGSEIYHMGLSEWPELEYSHSSVHDPYQEVHGPAHMIHHYNDQHEYYNSNGNSYEMYRGETKNDPKQIYNPQERLRRTQSQHVDSVVNHTSPLSYGENSKLGILNTLPSDEPVTMIFMGYQKAEEDAQSYEGSIQAELVIIGDGEEEALTSATPSQKKHAHSSQNHNTNNASAHLTSETPSPASLTSRTV
ncbi:palmdelphin isoform X2 [Neoarius graeffei]|uniref:palmdelphin isoform X2 n=1 Tax=Neoarius graeffei TaxID=443677 RepID=UPI00298CDC72|nr:palmdelphin isoform X2 [Neoarius graeffei]